MQNFRRNDNKLGYLYVLTPSGMKQKLLMTKVFLAEKESEFDALSRQIATLRGELAARPAELASRPQDLSES